MSNAGVVVNESERPRVLVLTDPGTAIHFGFVNELPGTYRFINSFSEIDPSEWDGLITDQSLGTVIELNGQIHPHTRRAPDGLNIFFVHRPGKAEANGAVLDYALTRRSASKIALLIQHAAGIPGNSAIRVDGLPQDLQSLVQTVLVPRVSARPYQWGHTPKAVDIEDFDSATYRPFLMGPKNTVLAGSYVRAKGSTVWIVPNDLPDFKPWYEIALREWHEDDNARFPGRPNWAHETEWMTSAEVEITKLIDSERTSFEPLLTAHEIRITDLETQLRISRERGNAYERLLLTAQDDDLQVAVFRALVELGFQVTDMDEIWPVKQRREDFRISDEDEVGWSVIGDATGVSKGVKASKLTLLAGYVSKFVFENRSESIPGQWLLVNHFIGRDPNLRGTLLRPDELALFAASDGLVIDTAALFVLLTASKLMDDLSPRIRSYLRDARGQLSLEDAKSWLANV
ncbi:hypothetical protein QN345_00535 [Cryobacterium sp. 10I1]|uniref:hypothetical protein n=1 Tax=Cryobacterium sp. 10I1 TaxID=3048578 RepID=UPI002B238B5D|nr:hypothetical protein [Cryobacterium sp. 10I1]MEB0303826.1 hypothetical protein [Cryobacterium sp. 10I1]